MSKNTKIGLGALTPMILVGCLMAFLDWRAKEIQRKTEWALQLAKEWDHSIEEAKAASKSLCGGFFRMALPPVGINEPPHVFIMGFEMPLVPRYPDGYRLVPKGDLVELWFDPEPGSSSQPQRLGYTLSPEDPFCKDNR